jgi:hypothetical protein
MKHLLILALAVPMAAQTTQEILHKHASSIREVQSCDKRNWPVSDMKCLGTAAGLIHGYIAEHPEWFGPDALKAPDIKCGDGTMCRRDVEPGRCVCVPTSVTVTILPPGHIEPLVCGKYQHAVHTPAYCANTCPPDGNACTAQCLYVAETDACVDDIHVLTEADYQAIMARLKALEGKASK